MAERGLKRRRTLRWVVVSLVIVFCGWVLACASWLSTPAVDPVTHVDAIYVLGPADGRIAAARAAAVASGARTMVVTVTPGDERQQRRLGCFDEQPYEFICLSPDPLTTQGESRTLAALVRQRGWSRVAVVTSTTHIPRARELMWRCVPVQVLMWEAPESRAPARLLWRYAYESGAWAKAGVVRGC